MGMAGGGGCALLGDEPSQERVPTIADLKEKVQ